jgi:hypothetical protein
MCAKPTKVVQKGSKIEEKPEDFMKVTPEELYAWIDYAFEKIDTTEGRASMKNAWKGCGYISSI